MGVGRVAVAAAHGAAAVGVHRPLEGHARGESQRFTQRARLQLRGRRRRSRSRSDLLAHERARGSGAGDSRPDHRSSFAFISLMRQCCASRVTPSRRPFDRGGRTRHAWPRPSAVRSGRAPRAPHTRRASSTSACPTSRVRCFACGHRCLIPPGHEGICRVRFNDAGTLRVPFGYVGALQLDPVEKKPFFHALPGATALSFGMLGCDYHCGYCQNWLTSQALRDPDAVVDPRARHARPSSCGLAQAERRADRHLHLQRAAHHQRVGGRGLQGGEAARASSAPTSPTATARPRCSTTSAPGSRSTRSTSRASATVTTASSAAPSTACSRRSAPSTRRASGSRS